MAQGKSKPRRKARQSSIYRKLEHFRASLNSYLGFMRGKQSYGMRRKAFAEHCPLLFDYFYIGGHFEVVKIKSEYSIKYQLLRIECYD